MSATLNIRNNFNVTVNGNEITGKQGAVADAADDYFEVTLDGLVSFLPSQLFNSTAITLWYSNEDSPVEFKYMHIWVDRDDCYFQIVGSTQNVQIKLKSKVPFVLPTDLILSAANTTLLDGTATPSMELISKIVLSNRSGATVNYTFFLGN